MKVKSESEVAQLCLILSDPMDCMQHTRILHPWDFQARVLKWGAIAFSVMFLEGRYYAPLSWILCFRSGALLLYQGYPVLYQINYFLQSMH